MQPEEKPVHQGLFANWLDRSAMRIRDRRKN
jgi:hypothetical protein